MTGNGSRDFTPEEKEHYGPTVRAHSTKTQIVYCPLLDTTYVSINNFSGYDISQSVDWECPSLSPHVFLVKRNCEICPSFPFSFNHL